MTQPVVGAMLDAALEYARRGDPVFPVWSIEEGRCGCRAFDCQNPGKHPVASCAPHGLEDATTDETAIRRWWSLFPTANIAMRTGITRTVLDVDPAKGGRESLAKIEAQYGHLPTTAKVLTGGGGEHYHFAPVPGLRNSAGRIGRGLDIRGEGGYVLLPPSNHASGGSYLDDLLAPMYDTPLAAMPAWLVTLAAMPAWLVTLAGAPAVERGGNGHRATSDEWGEKLAGAPEGRRREEACKIAGHYLGLRIAPEEVIAILLGYAARCTPPFPEAEVRELVRDLARRDRTRMRERTDGPTAPAVTSPDGPLLVRLADVQAEAVEWLWPGRIPRGKLSLIIGEPGEGKTTVLCDALARASRGFGWPDGADGTRGDAILLTAEDGIADTIRPRVDRQDGDVSRVHVLRGVRIDGQECPFTLERDLPALERAIATTQAVLVGVDPLSAYLGTRDSYKDAEIRGILGPLAALAERHRVAVVGILHLTKAAQRRLLNRAQGSIAFVAAARAVLAVGQDPNVPGRRLLVSIKNNVGPEAPALAFAIGDTGVRWESAPVDGRADALLAQDEAPTRTESRERDEAAAFLRQLLKDGPVASKQVETDAKANGISQRTLWRAKADLGITAERSTQAGKAAWYWLLPVPGADE